MTKWRFVYLGSVVTAAVIGVGLWTPLKQAVAKDPNKAPRFKVDPFWPKPLPSDVETNPAAAMDGISSHHWATRSVKERYGADWPGSRHRRGRISAAK